jgi:hypothetical protein
LPPWPEKVEQTWGIDDRADSAYWTAPDGVHYICKLQADGTPDESKKLAFNQHGLVFFKEADRKTYGKTSLKRRAAEACLDAGDVVADNGDVADDDDDDLADD